MTNFQEPLEIQMSNIVFKYLPIERLSYLEDELLRITQPGALNDPFECLPMKPTVEDVVAVLNNILANTIEEIDKMAFSESDKIKFQNEAIKATQIEISDVKKDSPGNLRKRYHDELIAMLNVSLGVLSLSRRWDSNLMWAHYTASHKGFCIGFDAENPFFNNYRKMEDDSGIIFMPVIYSDERVKIDKEKEIDPNWLLIKSKDWAYEEEERMLILLNKAHKRINSSPLNIHLYKVPHGLIKEIIVGANIVESDLKIITTFCKERNIELYKSQVSESKFDMTRIKL